MIKAQTPSTFENVDIAVDTFLNGMDASFYVDGDAEFPTFFDTQFSYWASGWAISSTTDSETSGFGNLYSAKPGSGVNGSQNYAIGQQNAVIKLTGDAVGQSLKGMYITNTTYAHNSMRDGDDFAKKFGGESGDDPDYFLLKIKPYAQGQLFPDSIEFYLADFRSENNDEDYIISDWTYVDLSSLSENVPLGAVDSLLFTLESTDFNDWGFNTPLFFAIDNFNGDELTSVNSFSKEEIVISTFPNPVMDKLTVQLPNGTDAEGLIQIFDNQGRQLVIKMENGSNMEFDMSQFPAGVYWVKYSNERAVGVKKIVKQ